MLVLSLLASNTLHVAVYVICALLLYLLGYASVKLLPTFCRSGWVGAVAHV